MECMRPYEVETIETLNDKLFKAAVLHTSGVPITPMGYCVKLIAETFGRSQDEVWDAVLKRLVNSKDPLDV